MVVTTPDYKNKEMTWAICYKSKQKAFRHNFKTMAQAVDFIDEYNKRKDAEFHGTVVYVDKDISYSQWVLESGWMV